MDNFILKNENAIYYECKFSCDNVIFLSLGSEKFFITDARYTIEAKEYAKNCEVIESANPNGFNLTLKIFRHLCKYKTWAEIEDNILSMTQPVFGKSDNVLEAPFYKTSDVVSMVVDAVKTSKFTGLDGKLVSVQIGQWFKTPAIMNVTVADRSYSTKMDPDGKPQYMDITLSFEPYRALDSKEANWIMG